MPVQIRRIYEPASLTDGERVLVDRLWPRGLSKQSAAIDAWMKDVAPSAELRKWFGHKAELWDDFQVRYRAELEHNPLAAQLRRRAAEGMVTLLYAARDEKHNHALVLADFHSAGAGDRSKHPADA